jgi:3-oxoadipate CoA-transferase beta subunit
MMSLFSKRGEAKLVEACTMPLTGVACVSRVYTDYAVFDLGPEGATVRETYGISLAELRERMPIELR